MRELLLIFLKLGAISFGGPLAHIALMEREFVSRRSWLSRQEFLDASGAVNLIPGPNSTELAMFIGFKRGGNRGLWLAGCGFIAPAVVIVLCLAIVYERIGQLALPRALLAGIAPVIMAIVAHALWKLAPVALKNPFTVCLAAFALALEMSRVVNEITIIFIAAAIGLVAAWLKRTQSTADAPQTPAEMFKVPQENENTDSSEIRPAPALIFIGASSALPSAMLFWTFFKIGAILYGSGYVLLAFLRDAFVPRFLSDAQLLDAVAIGQITPGPVFTTATFIGFQIGAQNGGIASGIGGALAATAGIFAPSFLLVGLLAKIVARAQNSPAMRSFLDAVNAASLALMCGVAWQLGRAALVDWAIIVVFLIALACVLTTRINSAWLILGGAIFGWARWMTG